MPILELPDPPAVVGLGRPATMAVQLYSGESRVDSSEAVTVEVRRDDGTVVLAAGTATTAPDNTIGRYEVTLTPDLIPDVDILTATWSATVDGIAQTRTTTLEVAGGYYFELPELRAMPGLSDTTRYPTAKLAAARAAAEKEIERSVGTAFVERYVTARLTGYGEQTLAVRPYVRRVLSVENAGVALTADEVDALVPYPTGLIVRPSGYFGLLGGHRDVTVRYAYAWSIEPPVDIHDIALELARHHLLGWRSSLPDAPVDADELGRESASAEDLDRRNGRSQIDSVTSAWRTRLFGSGELASVQIR